MNFRKSTLLLLLVALTIFVSLSAISATDVNNDTVKPCSFSNESGEIDGGAIYAVPYPKNDSIAVVENSTNNTNNDVGQIPVVNDGNSTNNTTNDMGQISGGKNIIDKNVVNGSTGSFTELQDLIDNNDVVNLIKNYTAIGSEGRIHINRNTIINGNGHTLNGNKKTGILEINDGNIVFNDLVFTNGKDNNGGAIHVSNSGLLTFNNVIFTNNYAKDNGGAICDVRTNLNLVRCVKCVNCTFNNNMAENFGGAIYSDLVLQTNYCTFKDNCVDNDGGAIYTYFAEINNSLFESNKAKDGNGGAIHAQNDAKLENDIFVLNTAKKRGGAIHTYGVVTSDNSTFKDNCADDGGAIYGTAIRINILKPKFKSFFINNIANDNGGAIFSKQLVKVVNTKFYKNSAEDYGGAIYSDNASIYSSYFNDNKVNDNDGGAIYVTHFAEIEDSIFCGNNALVDGGAIKCSNGHVTNCLFDSNKAKGATVYQCDGGAIYCKNDLTVDNSTFRNNYAGDYGGAIYADTLELKPGCIFVNNTAYDNQGGAIYSIGDAYIENSIFCGNNALVDGGAIKCSNGHVTNCLFDSNKAKGATVYQCDGGAIYCKNDLTVDNSTFRNNYAGDYGGAIYADTLELKPGCIFVNNTAYDNQGGAIWVNIFRENVKYVTFINNKAGAKDDGGAIYINKENHILFTYCTFKDNYAGDEGGAIYLDSTSSELTLKDNSFINNHAGNEGQVVFNKGTYGTIEHNWWGTNSDFSKDLLVEWKFWKSNIKHKDSNPLNQPLM